VRCNRRRALTVEMIRTISECRIIKLIHDLKPGTLAEGSNGRALALVAVLIRPDVCRARPGSLILLISPSLRQSKELFGKNGQHNDLGENSQSEKKSNEAKIRQPSGTNTRVSGNSGNSVLSVPSRCFASVSRRNLYRRVSLASGKLPRAQPIQMAPRAGHAAACGGIKPQSCSVSHFAASSRVKHV
jgi:hypothetical protein